MTDELTLLRNEVDRLETKLESRDIELMSLRRFIRSLQSMMQAVDQHLGAEGIIAILEDILGHALSAVNATNGSVLVLDEDSRELEFLLAVGSGESLEKLKGLRLPAGTGIAGWVAENKEPTIIEDVQSDDRFYDVVDQNLHFTTKSVLATPILGGNRVYGVVEILNKEPGKMFSVDDLNLVSMLCRFAGELLHSLNTQTSEQQTN